MAHHPTRVAARAAVVLTTAAVLSAVALSAGCGSPSSNIVTLDGGDNGQTVMVARGQRITVTLDGTSWQFALSPVFGPLAETSSQLTSGRTSTASADFVAGHSGHATIRAHRSTCAGHACGAGQSDFVLQVAVSG
ncbi:MAG: hypothetical protein ACYDB3_09800 [Acidimicrobiales bacterium]